MTTGTIIFLVILIFGFGGCLGAYIVLKYWEKSTDDLMKSYHNFVNAVKRCRELDRQIFQEIYMQLVKLRDGGTENLDELIGFVGELLDDHKEEKE